MKVRKSFIFLLVTIIAALAFHWAMLGHTYRTETYPAYTCPGYSPFSLTTCRDYVTKTEKVKVPVPHKTVIEDASLGVAAISLVAFACSIGKHK